MASSEYYHLLLLTSHDPPPTTHHLLPTYQVGVSVLLSDVDIVVTSNPFLALYRDTDVEVS